MRSSFYKAALLGVGVVAGGLTASADAYAQESAWWSFSGGMFRPAWWGYAAPGAPDGPTTDGPYYTGPYRGAFSKLAYPGESRCLMEWRQRPAQWGKGYSYYTVQVCR